jgi:hypothetical protein
VRIGEKVTFFASEARKVQTESTSFFIAIATQQIVRPSFIRLPPIGYLQ